MELYEKTLKQNILLNGRVLKMHVDTVKLPNGKTSTREVVDHPGGVCILALDDQKQVLMVSQYRYPYEQVITELPAGKLERGEDPDLAAIRELREETGASAGRFERLGELYPSPGYCDEVIYLYLATGLHATAAHPDADEFLEVERRPLEDAVKGVMAGEFPDAKTQIGLLKAYQMLHKGD